MTAASHREYAVALLVDHRGRFLLQRRDNFPSILFPGLIGLFGGQREGDETFLECVVREVHEETGVLLAPERFEDLLSIGGLDPEVAEGTVRGQCYLVTGVAVEPEAVTEGALVVATAEEIPALMDQMTPVARMALSRYLSRRASK